MEKLLFPDTVFQSREEKQTKSTAGSTWATQLTTRYSELENSADQRLSNVSVPMSPDEAMYLTCEIPPGFRPERYKTNLEQKSGMESQVQK